MPVRFPIAGPFLRRRLAHWTSALLDTLFPQSCLACDAPIFGRDRWWCESCLRGLLQQTGGLCCPTCGRSTGPYEVIDRRCSQCSLDRCAHDGLVRVAPYGGVIRRAIRRFKFERQQRLDQALGRLLAAAIDSAPWRDEIEAIVPVPSHWTVRLRRGFFSTGALAAQTAALLHRPCVPLLVRPRRGRSQIGLPEHDRRKNVRGAFALRRGARVQGRTLCVVDDVMATGATMFENARLLKKAGARAVYAAVIARSDPAAGPLTDS